jgi:uncharacterized protein with beta-barrel porin domain
VSVQSNNGGADVVVGSAFRVAPADAGLFADANQAMALDAQRSGDAVLGHAMGDDAASCASALPAHGNSGAIAGAIAGAFCGAGGWVEATDTALGSSAYSENNSGFLAGLDRQVGSAGTRLGLAVGYDSTTLKDAAGGRDVVATTRLGVYGMQPVAMLPAGRPGWAWRAARAMAMCSPAGCRWRRRWFGRV